ncbi:MAG: 4Fe-4S binding protein [Bacillota bacterium]
MNRIKNLWKRHAYIILVLIITGGFIRREAALGAIVCMTAPIILAGLGMKRYWCKNLCPRGSFFDCIMTKHSKRRTIPMIFKQLLTRIIIVILIFSGFGWSIWRLRPGIEALGGIFHKMVILTTFIGIILALRFSPRTWCSICPMGSIAAFITYLKSQRSH